MAISKARMSCSSRKIGGLLLSWATLGAPFPNPDSMASCLAGRHLGTARSGGIRSLQRVCSSPMRIAPDSLFGALFFAVTDPFRYLASLAGGNGSPSGGEIDALKASPEDRFAAEAKESLLTAVGASSSQVALISEALDSTIRRRPENRNLR
ncbi:hypothetical protein B0H67DRAFT_110790 [Lasiosphaeris hirsuta]|uniref:Uncharacterized protein n=1 Tax=Lasiosphaeris hirsuta TaxID=260670 RepID=A0AA40E4F6_9PEZI|nr:hypothetical protein B0H67DRAFT_110790 [Lasiosphaeris hirsuta]